MLDESGGCETISLINFDLMAEKIFMNQNLMVKSTVIGSGLGKFQAI